MYAWGANANGQLGLAPEGGGAFSSLGFRVYFDLRASGPEFWVLGFELGSIRFLPVFVVSFQKKRC